MAEDSLIELLPMTRRGFMQSMLAFAAAPAIVRISSLMPVRSYVDWTSFVREIVQYAINNDSMAVRWDILDPIKGAQFHVDQQLFEGRWNGRDYEETLKTLRAPALIALRQGMKRHGMLERNLAKLELPQGIAHAKYLNG